MMKRSSEDLPKRQHFPRTACHRAWDRPARSHHPKRLVQAFIKLQSVQEERSLRRQKAKGEPYQAMTKKRRRKSGRRHLQQNSRLHQGRSRRQRGLNLPSWKSQRLAIPFRPTSSISTTRMIPISPWEPTSSLPILTFLCLGRHQTRSLHLCH